MIIKIINSVLILITVFMGLKQGYSMFVGNSQMIEIFGKWNIGKLGVMMNGLVTIMAAILILFPKTFVWGSFLMAAEILLIMCFHLLDKDLKGVWIELPFLLLNLIIIYLQHPLKNQI